MSKAETLAALSAAKPQIQSKADAGDVLAAFALALFDHITATDPEPALEPKPLDEPTNDNTSEIGKADALSHAMNELAGKVS